MAARTDNRHGRPPPTWSWPSILDAREGVKRPTRRFPISPKAGSITAALGIDKVSGVAGTRWQGDEVTPRQARNRFWIGSGVFYTFRISYGSSLWQAWLGRQCRRQGM